MRAVFLNRPFLVIAFVCAGVCLVPSSPGALVSSRGASAAPERELLVSSLEAIGFSRHDAETRVAGLSDREVATAAAALERNRVGAGDDGYKKALSAGLVIIVVLAAVTGVYFFVNN
ncbi:MAG TPA: hypothetical protein PK636_10005 [bacterium]|nr:hypothetical protein [bacterium]HPJ73008.1 hypothetical protein [bacterium]HPQ67216.1 hypothetical protein [bacterium]